MHLLVLLPCLIAQCTIMDYMKLINRRILHTLLQPGGHWLNTCLEESKKNSDKGVSNLLFQFIKYTVFFSKLRPSSCHASVMSDDGMPWSQSSRKRVHVRNGIFVDIWHDVIVRGLGNVLELWQSSAPFSKHGHLTLCIYLTITQCVHIVWRT